MRLARNVSLTPEIAFMTITHACTVRCSYFASTHRRKKTAEAFADCCNGENSIKEILESQCAVNDSNASLR